MVVIGWMSSTAGVVIGALWVTGRPDFFPGSHVSGDRWRSTRIIEYDMPLITRTSDRVYGLGSGRVIARSGATS